MPKKEIKKRIKQKRNPFTIPKRASAYLLKTLLIVVGVVLIAYIAFMTAMHAANIYILVTEGMALRASCILGEGDSNEMYEYFNTTYMKNETSISESPYKYYTINNYDYRLSVDKISLWAFNSTATMTVTERIPNINGAANANAPSSAVPDWTAHQYLITCVKTDGRWYINTLKVLVENPPEKKLATPNMSLFTTAAPTPTPIPSPSILPDNTDYTPAP